MATAEIQCDVSSIIGEIDPFIYGHFIEHLAQCLYGGMWAEMLVNRKFAGHDQAPGGRHTFDSYGIPHPWYAVNRSSAVRYAHDNTIHYNGVQSERIRLRTADGAWHGVGQGGIAVEKGRRYDVRLVLSQSEFCGPVRVRLGKGETVYAEASLEGVSDSWGTYNLVFTSAASDDDAEFSICLNSPGTLWIGAASLMPADNILGWRRDVVDLIRAMHVPVLRYPGGNFVSGYRWQDGIGDRDRRPIRWDRAWNVWEPNDVGTDEFIQLCQLLDIEPYISVNAGDGTAAEAAAWVEYCNGAPNSTHGAQRAAHGYPAPYGVKYWGIGNEMYGNWQIGHVDGETFARRHNDFAYAMRAVDPRIILLGVGDMPDRPGEWLETVTSIAGANIDLMTVHHYTRVPQELDEITRDAMTAGCPVHIEKLLIDTARILDELGPQGRRIDISFDEWNIVHAGVGSRQNYALRDGLYAAGMFHAFQRQCARVKMANIAQLVNLLGVIETTKTGVYGTPIYWAFRLYQEHCGQIAIQTKVTGPTYDLPAISNIPAIESLSYLDAVGSLSREGNMLSVAVINRHSSEAITAAVSIVGSTPMDQMHAWELNGPDMGARNSVENKENVGIRDRGIIAAGSQVAYTFPAHSVTVLQIPLK